MVPGELELSDAVRPFCTPPDMVIGTEAAFDRFVGQADHRVIDVGDYRVPVWHFQGGHRGTVVLAHGWAVSSTIWRVWVKPLQKAGFAVTIFDAPAHGRATGQTSNLLFHAAALQAVCETHDDIVGIVGHSLGGMAAAVVSAGWSREGTRADGLTLCILSAPAHMKAVVDEYGARFSMPRAVTDEVEAWILDASGMRADVIGLPMLEVATTTRALVLHDPEDPEAAFGITRDVVSPMPHVVFEEVSGLGHERIVVDRGVLKRCLAWLGAGSSLADGK